MTLGEFRKLTEQMPDDTPLKFGYADGVRNVNSFEANGTSLVLCEGIYDQLDGISIARAMLKLRRKQNEKQMVSRRGRILPRNRYNPINPMP